MSQLIKCKTCGKDLVWCPNYDKEEESDEDGHYVHYTELATLKLSKCKSPRP